MSSDSSQSLDSITSEDKLPVGIASHASNRAYEEKLIQKVEELFLGKLLENRFLIEKNIGQGGSSVVFSATDTKELKKVAVKVLARRIDNAGKSIQRFNQEARTTRYLRHDNILNIYSYGVEHNHAYFVMEYLSGGTLEDLLKKRKRLPVDKSVSIVKQVASALSYAHREGVIHRDVKPSNILFESDSYEKAKIVDFGLSTKLSWDYSDESFITPTGDVFGTTLYISPEQSKGKRTDQRTDVYSLGCVFYECLTGEAPHTGDSALEIVLKHQKDEIVPINERVGEKLYSVEIETIVSKMLRRNPKDRYKDFNFILEDFRALENNQFNYKRYLRGDDSNGGTDSHTVVKDHSNTIFLIALFLILVAPLIAIPFWGEVSGFISTIMKPASSKSVDNAPVDNVSVEENPFDLYDTRDIDRLKIRQTLESTLNTMTKPAVDPRSICLKFTRRWQDNDYRLLKETWANPSIRYEIQYGLPPEGAMKLVDFHRKAGIASVLIDANSWISVGPRYWRFTMVENDRKDWIIDTAQPVDDSVWNSFQKKTKLK